MTTIIKPDEITKLEVYPYGGKWYVDTEFTSIEKNGTHRYEIDRIPFLKLTYRNDSVKFVEKMNKLYTKLGVDFGFDILYATNESVIHDKIVELPVKEVTLKEIEEKFGCKVKIISEED